MFGSRKAVCAQHVLYVCNMMIPALLCPAPGPGQLTLPRSHLRSFPASVRLVAEKGRDIQVVQFILFTEQFLVLRIPAFLFASAVVPVCLGRTRT